MFEASRHIGIWIIAPKADQEGGQVIKAGQIYLLASGGDDHRWKNSFFAKQGRFNLAE